MCKSCNIYSSGNKYLFIIYFIIFIWLLNSQTNDSRWHTTKICLLKKIYPKDFIAGLAVAKPQLSISYVWGKVSRDTGWCTSGVTDCLLLTEK